MTDIVRLYELLAAEYGPQHWWPADTAFEIMAGALLVQRTNWRNAERALRALNEHRLLDPEQLARADHVLIEQCIRSAGFYRTKAQRLRGLARFVVDSGGVDSLAAWPHNTLKSALLALPGIGAETAAAILAYAFGRPEVVIDAYLRRLVQRLDQASPPVADADIASHVLAGISRVDDLNEFHALVVAHGKHSCTSQPRCDDCCVRGMCGRYAALSDT